ncbi:hypothetical protein MHBO_002811 [Bonamia ostreae]|uniref:Uncharacterized protein n=1 Tax=Bonamia ostreae TaxID=126728 RepID=A0ABV2ANL8_9EUKA
MECSVCPKTAIPNGKYSSNCGTTVGQTCIALCNEKFLPPSTTLKCEFKNRQSHFNPQTVTCKKVQCPGMTKPSIGVDLKKCATPTNVDDKCNWGCKAKFKPHKTTSTIAICQFAKKTNTGTWSVVPKCDPVFETCGLPQDKSIDVSRCQQKIADDECVAICPDGRIVRTKCTKTSNAKPVFSPPIVCSRKKDETERNLVYGLSGAAIGIVILILIVVTVICCRRKHASEEIEEQSESSDENTKRSNSDSLSTKSPVGR